MEKHEEEVQLRLFFEQKLNSLHHVNRELSTKVSVYSAYDILFCSTKTWRSSSQNSWLNWRILKLT